MKRFTIALTVALLPFASIAQHTLILKDGEVIKGELMYMKGETITFFNQGRSEDFKTERVRTIHFYDQKAEAKKESLEIRKEFKNGFNKVTYMMDGRTMKKFPKIALGSVESGVVVVDIIIDKYGNVKSAEPGAAGTQTSNDKYLFVKAKTACQGAKFNSNPVAPLSTRGKIWVEF